MRTEAVEQRQSSRWKSLVANTTSNWLLFCLAILFVKFLLLTIDPLPRFYPGDSLGYIWAAITGQVPDELSYSYSVVVRWLCNATTSLDSLIIVQTFLGVIITLTVAWVCRSIFLFSQRLSFLFGLLCCIDPLQLTWERYILPQTFSLFFYGLVLHQSFIYLRSRRIATLVVIQVLSVITIGFKTIFLIPFQVMAIGLPLIAFASVPPVSASDEHSIRLRFLQRWIFWRHLAVSAVAMFALSQGYKAANSFLSHRGPADTFGTGYFLLSTWAPALQPQDSPDPRLAEIIRHGSEFDLKNDGVRNAQRFASGHLIDRWRHVEPDRRKSSEIAAQTAINALRRDPLGVFKIAAKTYYAFWRGPAMERFAQADLRGGKVKENQQKSLLARYHWNSQADSNAGTAEPVTFSRWFYAASSPYYFAILLSPLLSLVLLFPARNKPHAVLLCAHTLLIFAVTFLFSIAPAIRHLQPLSLLLLLNLALAVKSFSPAASEESNSRSVSANWQWHVMSRRQRFCALFGVLAVATILRMGLAGNQPLWNDEVFSLAMATGHSLEQPPTATNPVLGDFVQPNRAESPEELGRYIKHDSPPAAPGRVVRAVFLSDTSPPLYYLLLYVWTLVFGTSDAILRQFSIVCSLACLPFLAGIARRTAGPEAVLPSCLLFAFSPLGICFSTEGRMYALLWLCVISVTWLSLVWYERDQSILVPAAWVLTSAAGFLTHYFFIFPWAALVAFLLLRPEKISRIRITGCILLTALTIFPWYMRVPESLHSWRLMKDWLIWEPDGFSRLNATRTLLLQNFSGAGHHSSSNFVALAIFAIIAAAMLLRLRTKVFAGRWLLLWLLFFAPCVGVLAFDLIMHTYAAAHDRYAIAALPIGCLLAGAGLVLLPGRTRTVLLVLILVAWAPNLLISDQTTKRVTARYRAEAVSANQSPGDLVLIDAIPSGMLNIVRYLKGPAPVANWTPSWLQQPATQQTPESILRLAAGRSRIRWIAGAGAPPTPPERDWLRANAIASDETQIMSDFRPKNAETF